MRLLVTRPQREAQDWVRELEAAGISAQALPLIAILPAPDPAAVRQAWASLGRYRGVMFVSANAVDGFFAQRPPHAAGFDVTGMPRVWVPGPGSRQALLRAGVPTSCIDAPPADAAQFDSETLWQVMGPQVGPGTQVLLVRGADGDSAGNSGSGRDWFTQQVRAAGGSVDFLVTYRRARPVLDAAQLALARAAAQDGSVWLFSSSEAVHNLQDGLPGQDWRGARAIATHARIAEAARRAGFGQVLQVRPALPDILASIESLS